ncbi:MAG: hypothetical protein AAFV43_12765 [Planctomycetota bacterium]
MTIFTHRWLYAMALALAAATANATIPYTPVLSTPVPSLGAGVITPDVVFGKEYSHNLDQSTVGAGGVLDPEQVIAWDGMGGATDSVDYSGVVAGIPSFEIDALANDRDAYVVPIQEDRAHLVFSHDDEAAGYDPAGTPIPLPIPAGGPVLLGNGNLIGGAGELSIETGAFFTSPEDQSLWADQASINGMPLPRDVDGIELWGPEPPISDANRFSAEGDFLTGVSIWTDTGAAYLSHAAVVSAVVSLLGPVPASAELFFDDQEGTNTIDLDAMLVRERYGDEDVFDADPTGGDVSDEIIFSIRQIIDPADPDGYYATGSELFVLDALTGASFLKHGGHDWDHGYTLGAMSLPSPTNQFRGVIDINAIEAVGDVTIPEPVGVSLLVGMFGALAATRRRWG